MRVLSVCVAALLLTEMRTDAAAERYVAATVQNQRLEIRTDAGKSIVPRLRDGGNAVGQQVDFKDVVISPDRRTVGWLAMYSNCCTSYPIPLALVLYSDGKTREFTGTGLPIWRWAFQNEGNQVAFEQETVHGGIGIHYELRDVLTGRLLAQFEPKESENHDERLADITANAPAWVKQLDASR